MKSRTLAVIIIDTVIQQQRSLSQVFQDNLSSQLVMGEISLIKQICFGTLRYYQQLVFIAQRLMQKPLKNKDSDIYHLLLSGIYQLQYMHAAQHAVVKETVDVVIELKKPWAKALVNAVLRQFIRQQQSLLADVEQDEVAQCSHPQWLLDKIKKDWPNDWQKIIAANNQQAPMSLRVNQLRISRDEYLQQLNAAAISARVCEYNNVGVILEKAHGVDKLPGFIDGHVSVQDCAAQLAASLLQCENGHAILDACAAPGGKTAHILESEKQFAELIAVDKDAARCRKIAENLHRLNLTATIKCSDANDLIHEYKAETFDRILLDAPCSATGVIRRHPDIKLLRRESDVAASAQQQYQLLKTLWPLLKNDGLLLYATCSIMPEENHLMIAKFLAEQSDARELVIKADWGRAMPHGRQILPGENGMDGFYYCLLIKLAR